MKEGQGRGPWAVGSAGKIVDGERTKLAGSRNKDTKVAVRRRATTSAPLTPMTAGAGLRCESGHDRCFVGTWGVYRRRSLSRARVSMRAMSGIESVGISIIFDGTPRPAPPRPAGTRYSDDTFVHVAEQKVRHRSNTNDDGRDPNADEERRRFSL